jgi:Phage portal protein, SPP1 Gp6-like
MDASEAVKEFTELLDANEFERLQGFDDYHRGRFDDPYLPSVNHSAIATEYRDLLSRANLPICGLVVSAVVDRLQVEGYQSTDTGQVDEEVWSWWQASNLDGRQSMLYADSLVFGDGYVLIVDEGEQPGFYVQSPLNMVVDLDSTNPAVIERAVKQVKNRGWLYTDEAIYAFRKNDFRVDSRGWELEAVTPHSAGEVPIVRFPNRMDSRGVTQSEIELISGPQRRIIQTLADRLMVQRAASWKQRWVSGIEVEVDKDGKAVPPFRVGVDQLVVSENPDARFGQWDESPFDAHLQAIEADIRHAAAISQTPPHLLTPASISNISADALIAMEAGLTAKVQQRELAYGEAWEHAFRIGAQMVGYTLPDEAEVIWADLERRSDAQKVDGVLKLNSIGLPLSYLLERLSLSPQKAALILDEVEKQQAKAAAAAAASFGLAPGQGPAEPGSFPSADAPNPDGV